MPNSQRKGGDGPADIIRAIACLIVAIGVLVALVIGSGAA